MTTADNTIFNTLVEVRKAIFRKVETGTTGAPVKEDKRASLSCWMNYWAPRLTETIDKKKLPSLVKSCLPPDHGQNNDAELAAFLAYWLIHDLFECPPKDIIRDVILHIAVLMSRGVTYPLDPMGDCIVT